ncbi:MAG: DUF881 domain-containing protein [Candidatus Limnocylindria bacterium]
MRRAIAQLSMFGVALLIGILLVGQLRSQASPIELSSLSAQELSTLIETLEARNEELRSGLSDLRAQVLEYERDAAQGQSSRDVTREDLLRIRAFGGLAPVEGQGVRLQVEGSLDAIAVNDLLYELRNAGAEAIALDDVRVTARSVAVQATDSLAIDGVAFGRSFVIEAVGPQEGLFSAMERPGGIKVQLEQSVEATIVVTEVDSLRLPATERDLAPQVARPVE